MVEPSEHLLTLKGESLGLLKSFFKCRFGPKSQEGTSWREKVRSPFLTPADQPCSSNQPPRRRENLTVFPGETSNSEDPDPDWSRSSETLPGSFRTPATNQFSYSPIWNFLMRHVKAIWFHSAEKGPVICFGWWAQRLFQESTMVKGTESGAGLL